MTTKPNRQTLPPSELIADRYRLVRLLARGGMGHVYLARQIGLDRLVALKTIIPERGGDPETIKRLRREAEAVQHLTHPNTVRIYDFGETDAGMVYLVMEYLDGASLDALLEEYGKLEYDTVVQIGRQVLKSLIEAHANGVIHRDIKPNNLMMCHQVAEVDFIKVLDFGLASVKWDYSAPITLTGAVMGTPYYMAPEQVRGQAVDGRTDLYSLGLTLFELATGFRAYHGRTAYEVALQHISPEPLRVPEPLVGTRLGAVIARATQKVAADRYGSAPEMLDALVPQDKERSRWSGRSRARGLLGPRSRGIHASSPETVSSISVIARDLRRLSRRTKVILPASLLAAVSLVVLLAVSSGEDNGPIEEPTRGPIAVQEGPLPGSEGTREETASPVPGRRVSITTDPPGAVVFLAERALCLTPCEERIDRDRGWVVLRVVRDGHQPFEAMVDLSQDVEIPIVLVPEASPAVADGGGDQDALHPVVRSERPRRARRGSARHVEEERRERANEVPEHGGQPDETQSDEGEGARGGRRGIPTDF